MKKNSANYIANLIEAAKNANMELADQALTNVKGFVNALYLEEIIDEEKYMEYLRIFNQIKIERGLVLEYQLTAYQLSRPEARPSVQ